MTGNKANQLLQGSPQTPVLIKGDVERTLTGGTYPWWLATFDF